MPFEAIVNPDGKLLTHRGCVYFLLKKKERKERGKEEEKKGKKKEEKEEGKEREVGDRCNNQP
jgi:hypothetical protein